MNDFKVPVVLFLFKRKDAALQIIERISQVKPKKIYLLSDHGRDEEEKKLVMNCRSEVEKAINWDCKIIKRYATKNIGVYENIGLGAKWVFEREDKAIFLEDDNLPEITFFSFCEQMLEKYEKNSNILWVCGTNYLEKYYPKNKASYMFTQHLLPCGWASWAHKFNKYYDGELELFEDKLILDRIKHEYEIKPLYFQQIRNVASEAKRKKTGQKFHSWDYQMAFSLKVHHLYGISPVHNQIKNIGVDEFSIHGGSNISEIMTKRFCGIKSYPMVFPLIHPKTILTDIDYERKIGKIILYPLKQRIRSNVSRKVRKFFHLRAK